MISNTGNSPSNQSQHAKNAARALELLLRMQTANSVVRTSRTFNRGDI